MKRCPKHFTNKLSFVLLLVCPLLANAQDETTGQEPPRIDTHWLAERAGTSDIVVLAQLDSVDYEYKRGFPVDGDAWLEPLITYKSAEPLSGILVVSEKGLSDNECYFPRADPWEERPRYLLFLVENEEKGTIRGHPKGCAIEMLVTRGNRYAARWPQSAFGGDNGRGDAMLHELVEEMTFQGPMARIDASDMLAHQRRDRAERDFMELDDKFLIPTRGIKLRELRRLMQPGLEIEEGSSARKRERVRELQQRMLETESGGEDSAG